MKPFMRLLFLIGTLLMETAAAGAHPMGNFSINHYTGLEVGKEAIRIRYILDFAEIPAFQEIQEIDADADGKMSEAEIARYFDQKIPQLTQNLVLRIGDVDRPLEADARELVFPPGAGGLPTLRLAIDYRAALPQGNHLNDRDAALNYRDDNYAQRTGWKEIAAKGIEGIALIGSPFPVEGSELRSYPGDPLQDPPQAVSAAFALRVGGGGSNEEQLQTRSAENGGGMSKGDALTSLMTGATPRGITLALALALAFGLGSLHALSPGHGKTLVAAYLVGAQGTMRHALLLGLCVTFAHTVGVFALGFVTLSLSDIIVPEALYPWLGRCSGLGIFVIGLSVFRKRLAGLKGGHHDDHMNSHAHGPAHPHGHAHEHDHPDTHETEKTGLHRIIALGISGGMIPCPSALIVLLSAVAFHQIGFGLFLIVAFSAGLAATLVGVGLLVVSVGGVFKCSEKFGPLVRYLPPLSAAGMAALGLVIALGGIGA